MMTWLRKKTPCPSPEIRYIMRFEAKDRFALAEYFDGAFTEISLDVRRGDEGFLLETQTHHCNAKQTNTAQKSLRPFACFEDFFSQLICFCQGFSLDKDRLKQDYKLMRFLDLYRFIHLLGDDQRGAESRDGNIIIMEGNPYIIRSGSDPLPTTWAEVKELAFASRYSTGLWLRDLDETNWEDYTFVSFPWWKPGPRRQRIYNFLDSRDQQSVWQDCVINSICRDPETGSLYLCHEIADGQSDHYPRFIGNDVPISAEEVARLEAAGLLVRTAQFFP